MSIVFDQLDSFFQESFRIVQKILQSPALHQNFIDCGRSQQCSIADRCDNIWQGLIEIRDIYCPHFPFHMMHAGLFNLNVRRLGNDPCLGNCRHFLQSFHAVLDQPVRINADPVSRFLLDSFPKIQELRRNDNLLVNPHNNIPGCISNGRSAICFRNDLLEALSGSLVFLRKIQRTGF